MLTYCYEQGGNAKEGTKAQFWTGVNEYSFSARYWEGLAQMSAMVRRLVEAGRKQISDWEAGVIPQKPGGKLNDRLDQWMKFLKFEDRENEAERPRQVYARRNFEEAKRLHAKEDFLVERRLYIAWAVYPNR